MSGKSLITPSTNTVHQIIDQTFAYLENRQEREIEDRNKFNFVFHDKAKTILRNEDKLDGEAIENLEKKIVSEACDFKTFEIICDAPRSLFYALKKENRTNLIFENRIVAVPNFILNGCVCSALEERFSKRDLLSVNGFIEVSFQDDEGQLQSAIRLDINEQIVKRGFMIPVFCERDIGLYKAIEVYRHPRDERPFILRSRK